jgi:hypothetical protein
MDGLFINLEGRYRFMKKHIKNFLAIYTDWEIINILKIYNKKNNILKYYFFYKYNLILQFFFKIIDYTCNFFFTLEDFFIQFFFFYGYKKKFMLQLYNNDLLFSKNLNYGFINKFYNTLFNRYINNYYSSDFFLRNSKIMSLSAIKTYMNY